MLRPLTRIELSTEDKAELAEARKLAAEAAGKQPPAVTATQQPKLSTAQRIGFVKK